MLVAGRDLIHEGWRLLHHPLYGNYRPHQQPYRSLLLCRNALTHSVGDERIVPDTASLELIESALAVYRADRVLDPRAVPDALLRACSLLDGELMRMPLEQSGWPVNNLNSVVTCATAPTTPGGICESRTA